jgi:hypothetical protein
MKEARREEGGAFFQTAPGNGREKEHRERRCGIAQGKEAEARSDAPQVFHRSSTVVALFIQPADSPMNFE